MNSNANAPASKHMPKMLIVNPSISDNIHGFTLLPIDCHINFEDKAPAIERNSVTGRGLLLLLS